MNTYELLVLLVVAFALVLRGWKQGNWIYIFVVCILLFAVYGLREATVIGIDSTSSYLHLFERMENYSWNDLLSFHGGMNTGFYLLTKLLYQWTGGNYQRYSTILAVFVTICFGHFIYRYSPNPIQSILYYFGLLLYTFHFSALKQSLAMSFILLAFDHVVKRHPIRFLLTMFFAAAFHFPALVFLPAYWLAKKSPGKHFLIVLAVALLVTYIFRDRLLNLMLGLYGDDDAVQQSMAGIAFLRTKVLVMILIVIAAMVLRKPTPEDRLYGTLLKFMGMAIIFQTFCGYNNIFERLADYYFQFAIIFIPMVFENREDRITKLPPQLCRVVSRVGPVMFCSFGVYRFLTLTMADPLLFPYQFFFQQLAE